MESANLHHDHHHLQEQLQLVYASVLPSSNYYGVGLASTHSLSPNFSFRNTVYQNGVNSDGIRDSRLEKNVEIDQLIRPPGPPPLDHHHPVTTNTNTMVQDLNFEWANHNLHDHEHDSHDSGFNINDHHHLLYLARIKQEENSMSEHNINSLIPITDFEDNLQFLYSMSSSCHQDSKNNGHEQIRDSLNEDEDEDHDHHHMGMSYIRGQFSQIYPSVNISNGNYYKQLSSSASSPPMISTSQLDHRSDQINLASASARFNDHRHHQSLISHSQYHHNDRLQQSSLSCSTTDHTTNAQASIASFNNKVAEGKRNSNLMERKPPQTGPKKSRLESRSSCPPFKVRKEKLGDRIAALQQLVAPFGKTDTASVLMEAIGYIKFLQNQVETLSVPYMKSSRNSRNYETIPNAGPFENGNEEPKRDLRSRGLCLVPLTCMSYVTGDYGEDSGGNNTTGICPPPNFLGGTC